MAEEALKEILFFSYEENLSSDFKSFLKNNNFKSYLKQGKEFTKISFEFILFCSLYFKINDRIVYNQNIAILNEEYIMNEDIEKFMHKIIIFPYHIKNKWGLIVIDDILESIKIKIIASNKIYQSIYLFLENIFHKLNGSIKFEELENKIEKIGLNDEFDSSKIIINFINELLDYNDINEFFKEYFNDINNNIINKDEKELNYETYNIMNKLFEKIDKEYDKLLSEYLNYINVTIITSKAKKINTKFITNKNVEDYRNNLNKNSENLINKKDPTKVGEEYDEIAKNITKDIMNFGFSNKIKSGNIQKKYKNKKMELIQKQKPTLDKIQFKDEDDEIFNDIAENKENNGLNLVENKQIDETTKNTINDILEYVLKEMKSKKKLLKRKYSQRNKTARINDHKQIEIIEEEDKESSASEMCKEKILKGIRDSISSMKDNLSFKDDLRESYKNRKMTEDNIIKEEKNETIKNNKNVNAISEKGKNIHHKKKIINPDAISKNIKGDLKEKIKKQIKNEILINQKENVIKININDNKTKIRDNSEMLNEIGNHKLSQSNNIIENNSYNVHNFEIEISNPYKIKDYSIDNNNLINLSPKDNKRMKQKINNKKFETKPKNIVFKNFIKKNSKINNISINTIKTDNIIIINNSIVKKYPKATNKKVQIKLINSKEPEDIKIPKDSKTKKKNIEIKIKSILRDKPKNSNQDNLSFKEDVSTNKSKKINQNQKEIKPFKKKNVILLKGNYERSHSDADQFQSIIDNQKGSDFINPFNRNNISDQRIKDIVNKNDIFLKNSQKMNKSIESLMNANNNKIIDKSDSNKNELNNTYNYNKFKKKIIKSKTQDFDESKKSGKKTSGFQSVDFFNLKTDCIIN